MQKRPRKSNQERTETTRTSLVEAARALFIERGYAETATPDLVAAAGMTRGALYHHFADKRALFAEVVEREAAAVAREVETLEGSTNPLEDLIAGGDAYLDAMARPGRARLLLVEAPAILSPAELDALEERNGSRTLLEGLQAAMASGQLRPLPLIPLTHCLGTAYDRAALDISRGGDIGEHRIVLRALVAGLATEGPVARQ